MANVQLLTQTSGFIEDRTIVITLRYHPDTKEFSVYTIHHNDYGSVNTLITSTYSFKLAEEAYKRNVDSLQFEDFETITAWTKYYEYHKALHDAKILTSKEFEYEIY